MARDLCIPPSVNEKNLPLKVLSPPALDKLSMDPLVVGIVDGVLGSDPDPVLHSSTNL